jgi:protoporphyrinogen oxidase
MSDPPSVAIIGGGVTGLTAAYRLLQGGCAVHLYEASDDLGGLVRTFEVAGEPLECFYHHLFTGDSAALRLFDELGVGERLEWHASRVGVFHEGRAYPFTSALDLLRFSPLSVVDRVRLGLMALRLRGEQNGSSFEKVSAEDWIRNEVSDRVLDVVWGPLLRGKFGEMWDQVVMTWLWNKIQTRFSSRRGRLSQREVLGYMRGSFGAWISVLVDRIRDLGCEIETSAPVGRLVSEGGRIGIEGSGATALFDAAVATISNERFEGIAPPLTEGYTASLRGTRYQDAVCLVLVLDRPFTDYYWLNMNDPDMPFVAVVEQTNLVSAERYGGRHVVYVSNYPAGDASLTHEDANGLMRTYLPHLRRINTAFAESWISDCQLFHARDAQPVFTVGAGSRVPEHRTPVPGLYLANMAQIYPEDRGQNYAIKQGEAVARLVLEDLAQASAPRYQV